MTAPVVHPFDDVQLNTPSFPPPFFYLQAELQRLQSLSDAVRSSGSVAPANCWLVESEQCKGKRVYRYVQLRNASTVKTRTLGRPNCAQHLDWKRRCQRRDALTEITQQMRLLIELIDRQSSRPIEFQTEEVESSHGRRFNGANFSTQTQLQEVPSALQEGDPRSSSSFKP